MAPNSQQEFHNGEESGANAFRILREDDFWPKTQPFDQSSVKAE